MNCQTCFDRPALTSIAASEAVLKRCETADLVLLRDASMDDVFRMMVPSSSDHLRALKSGIFTGC